MALTGPASASAVRLAISALAESTYGTSPTGDNAYALVRLTSDRFKSAITNVESETIRSDSQIDNIIRSDAQGEGGFDFELAYDSVFDYLAQMTLLSEDSIGEAAITSADDTVAAVAPSGALGAVGVAGYLEKETNWTTATHLPGLWVRLSGFAAGAAGNNDIFKILLVDNASSPKRLYLAGQTLAAVAAATAGPITVTALSQVNNGVSINARSFEKQFTDGTTKFVRYPGYAPQTMRVTFPTEGPITGSFDFIGKIESSAALSLSTAGAASGTPLYVAAGTTEPLTAGPNGYRVFVGSPQVGVASGVSNNWWTTPATMLSGEIRVSPRLRARKAFGTLGPALAPARGAFDITGNVKLYYNNVASQDDETRFNEYINGTTSGLAIVVKDSANNFYIFDVPNVKWTNGERLASKNGEDVILNLDFKAFRSSAEDSVQNTAVQGAMMRIAKGNGAIA